MRLISVYILSLCQLQAAESGEPHSSPVRRYSGNENLTSARWNTGQDGEGPGYKETVRRGTASDDHEFVRRFNDLLEALRDFAATYNAGHVINVKKVKAVRKAWHELEKSDWFKAQGEAQ